MKSAENDDKDDAFGKPVGVTSDAADAYLRASGWVKLGEMWHYPGHGVGFPRGKAVVRQYRNDVTRLLFVAQHSTTDVLSLLVPKALLDKALEGLGWLTKRFPTSPAAAREAVATLKDQLPSLAPELDRLLEWLETDRPSKEEVN